MPKIKLTKGVIKGLIKRAEMARKDLEFTDTDTPFEFGIRATPPNSRFRSGRLSWFCRVAFRGERKRYNLGDHPGVSLEEARDSAWEHKLKAKSGLDPKESNRGLTFGGLLKKYLATRTHLSERSRTTDDLWLVRRCADWHRIPLRQITRLMVSDRHIAERIHGDFAADEFKKTLFGLLKFAANRGHMDANPAAGIGNFATKKKKIRYLKDEEIPIIWRFLEADGSSASFALRMLLLTGQRPVEVYELPHDELSEEWWHLPADRTKPRRDHRIYLAEPTRRLIEEVHDRSISRKHYRPVFPGNPAYRPVSTLTPCMRRFRVAHPGFPAWKPHDCRRTFRTWLARMGCRKEISKALLNHGDKDTSDGYNCWMYVPERVDWWTRYADHIESLIRA